MRRLVVDSWPVVEWAYGREPVRTQFRELLLAAERGEVELFMSRINLGEVIYSLKRRLIPDMAAKKLAEVEALPVNLISISDADIDSAAEYKAKYRCSYADTFAAVLAVNLTASVVTGDPEFLPLQRDGILQLERLGA